jgi:hypothetical protein
MTMEDLDKEYLIDMYSKYSKSGIFDHLIYAIDYIESIESRTCESCYNFIRDKYKNDENTCIKGCGNIAIGCDVVYCSSDFCCNEWESKE